MDMTTFHITPSASVHTTASLDHAFDIDDTGADALLVNAGAFLIADGVGSVGAYLAATKAWTVRLDGSIVSRQDDGIRLVGGNAEASNVTVGADGEVGGYSAGIEAASPATIVNKGVVAATAGAGILIHNAGTHTITSSGTIAGSRFAILDQDGLSDDTVRNSGLLNGSVALGGGHDVLVNTGEINYAGSVIRDPSDPLVAAVALGDGVDSLVNSGTILGDIHDSAGSASVSNSGTIGGDVYLGSAADIFTNFRTVNGVVTNGLVYGVIDLGDHNDRFTGGARSDAVKDGNGADIVTFGAGDDEYLAVGHTGADGRDSVDGGTGIDTYDARDASQGLCINLDTVAHDLSPIAPGISRIGANTAMGADVAGASTDRITNFENAFGGSYYDVIYGTAGANLIDGGGGTDILFGYGGADRLFGGVNFDNLVGGAGRDVLTGGTEGDTFTFVATSDSGTTAATRELITDFEDGVDVISLSHMDAVVGTPVNDAFTFIGTNVTFGGHAGELRAYFTAQGQIVEGDVNGDRAADFSFVLNDPGHGIVLTGQDFFL
jgi:Ca2+-binding RTX toxin-like protein